MTDTPGPSDRPRTEQEIAADLRLRPDLPPVTRLSRRVLMGVAVLAGLGVGVALTFALSSGQRRDGPPELYNVDRKPTAEGLAGLPRDYAGLPREVPALGPPLPGDLGKPILSAQARGQAVPLPSQGPDMEAQRRRQEIEAARTSGLFAQVSGAGGALAEASEALAGAPGTSGVAGQGPVGPAGRGGSPADRRTASAERLQRPASPHVLQAGAVIAAALITGVRSDLPGPVTAQVTETVYDSPSGQVVLIPQGSRLLGRYDSDVAFGQSRVLLVWTRLILPDGRSLILDDLPAADPAGQAGLEDRVDYHWGRLFLAAGLSTVLGIGTDLGRANDTEIARAIREGLQDTAGRTGDEVVRRQLAVPPTLTIRPGFAVRVMVTRDLVLEPWHG